MAKLCRNYRVLIYTLPHTRTASPTINIPHQSGTFDTLDEPPPVCHGHPEATVTFKFTLGAVPSVGRGTRVRTCIHHRSTTQNGLTALKTLCAPPAPPSLPLKPWQPLIFLLSP